MTSILLIEDAEELAGLIGRELGVHGYEVHHAADGRQGLERCTSLNPDLVILDWMLPKMDGLEVLRRLRLDLGMMVPVLMLTARGEEADRVIGLELGADDYLSKPFSMRELIARIRALMRRMERVEQVLAADLQPQTKQLYHGTLVLDPDGYRVTLDGEPVDLSRTEFDLLTMLLRNPGRAFGRAYLLDTVWGERYVVGDRSVDNAILRLRRKLGAMGEQIETVWGIGYRMREPDGE
jgi:DNA-binding response OmpR family regulator